MEEKNVNFEDLKVRQESMKLCIEIYKSTKDCKDYGFKDQIQRASVSVPSNISEGYERQTNKEFVQFLFIAKGSCGELRTQLYLAKALQYLNKQTTEALIKQSKIISSMIQNLIKSRRNQ
jgi:four helix bundle protein